MAVEILAADGGAARRAFIALPYRLYRRDPLFVPPLRREQRALFSRTRHPFFAHADAAFFVARQGGRIVGRIEATVNHAYAAHDATTGFFGAFECEDDRAAATALLDAAATWLRARGKTRMRGPFTHSPNEEYGLLVESDGTPPTVQLTYNPTFYARHFDAYGLRKAKDFYAWWADASAPMPRLERIAEAARKRTRATVRPLRLADYDAEVERAQRLLNQALGAMWGFVPVTEDELRHAARQFRAVLKPELVLFCEIDDVPVGMALALPDLNQALARLRDGRLLPFGWWRLTRALPAVNQARLIALGVLPAFRKRGLEALLVVGARAAVRQLGYRGAELSMTVEDNTLIESTIAAAGGRRTKTYRVYEKALV